MIEFLLLGQTRYSDWFCIDFGFYLRQQHTILAVCLSNRLHPYSKVFRLYVLLANLAFSFCVSGFVGWLDHLQSPWYIPVSFVISPVVIFLLTTALEQLAICGIVRVDGTRRIYRWAGLGIGHILFYLIWIMLVPCCVLLGLLFSSFRSTEDAIEFNWAQAVANFRPEWDVFMAQWWLQTAFIGWLAEFPLLLCIFMYVRRNEEGECLVVRRLKWEKGQDLHESDPLMQASTSK